MEGVGEGVGDTELRIVSLGINVIGVRKSHILGILSKYSSRYSTSY